MTDRAVLWIWLQDCIGFANTNIKAIFDFFEKPEDIITSDEKFLRETGLFTVHTVDKIIRQDLRYAKKVYTDCMNMNYKLVPLFDKKYPERLRELRDCPVLLYVEGEMPETRAGLYTAIVGSRKATEESAKYAFDIAAGLALNDIVVVSGGATGVDTAAHKGCMSCGGKTIWVTGCGFSSSYLLRNADMRKEVVRNGALISEYPPYLSSQKHTFIQRNRIIAGISDCTLVVQAGMKSGSLKTYQEAKKNHRKVFYIKGDVYDERFDGSNLLGADGAQAIINHLDILDWYEKNGHIIPERQIGEQQLAAEIIEEQKSAAEIVEGQQLTIEIMEEKAAEEDFKADDDKILSEQLTDNAVMVYHTISDAPITYDDISNQTNLSAQAVKSALTELEIMGYIKSVAGRGYTRK